MLIDNIMNLLLSKIKTNYILILQFTAWIISIISAFIFVPIDEEIDLWIKFSYFFVSAIIGISLVFLIKYRAKKYAMKWFGIAIVLFLTGTVIYVYYMHVLRTKTVEFTQESYTLRVVCGDKFLKNVQDSISSYERKENTILSKPQVLETFTDFYPDIYDKASDITPSFWDEKDITRNRYLLIGLFFGLLTCFSLFVIFLMQVINCYATKPK